MTTATATLEGVPVTRCRVQVPAWGLWWADPAAGLVIAAFLVREGAEAVSG